MLDFGLSNIITGGISALAGLGGSYMNQKAVEKQNEGNMRLAEYQYQKNLEMWNRQNEYNNPVAQMERLKAAGLNPNMVYGNGSAANQASNAPSYEAPRLESYQGFSRDFQGAANAFMSSQLTAQQVKNMEEQNSLLRIDQTAKTQQVIQKNLEIVRKMMENKAYAEDYDSMRALTRWNTQIAESNTRKLESEIMLNMSKDANLQAENYLIQARTALTNQEFERVRAEIPKVEADARIRGKEAFDYENLGLRPSDPYWSRILTTAVTRALSAEKAQEVLKMLFQ